MIRQRTKEPGRLAIAKRDFTPLERYLTARYRIRMLALYATTPIVPIKLPARRRRQDREIPQKAA